MLLCREDDSSAMLILLSVLLSCHCCTDTKETTLTVVDPALVRNTDLAPFLTVHCTRFVALLEISRHMMNKWQCP